MRLPPDGLRRNHDHCLHRCRHPLAPSSKTRRPLFPIAIVLIFGGDIVGYTFLPRIGLRHAVFIGGDTPEPRIGAIAIGMAPQWFDRLILAHALALLGVLVVTWLMHPSHRPAHADLCHE